MLSCGTQIPFVLRANVRERYARRGVILRVLHEVVGVRLAPITALAARARDPAHRATVDRRVVGLHELRSAPRIGEHTGAIVGLDLPGEPQLPLILTDLGERQIRRLAVRAARRPRLDREPLVGTDLVAQDRQSRPAGRTVEQAQHLLLDRRRRAHQRLRLPEPLRHTKPGDPLVPLASIDRDHGCRGAATRHARRATATARCQQQDHGRRTARNQPPKDSTRTQDELRGSRARLGSLDHPDRRGVGSVAHAVGPRGRDAKRQTAGSYPTPAYALPRGCTMASRPHTQPPARVASEERYCATGPCRAHDRFGERSSEIPQRARN